ncbi:hypothetical protein JCM10212_004582 [Sporobolomyces blumeae]
MPRESRPSSVSSPVSTITLQPSHPASFTVQHALFLHSDQWVGPLRQDVSALVTAFAREWRAEIQRQGEAVGRSRRTRGAPSGRGDQGGATGGNASASSTSTTARVDGEALLSRHRSPFEVFKEIWVETGWDVVHLVGIADGPARTPWGESVLRAFGEYLVPRVPPLEQVAALFAIYTFVKMQPTAMQRQLLRIDVQTLDYVMTFPQTLAPHLDPTNASPLDPPPASDVSVVLSAFLSRSDPCFHLVPSEIFQHPRDLPCVNVKDARSRNVDDLAKQFLGIEEEGELLRKGREDEIERIHRGDHARGDETSQRDLDHGGDDSSRKRKKRRTSSWMGPLELASATYAKTKSRSSSGGSTSTFSRSTLGRPRSQLLLDVMNEAEERTMDRVRQVGLEGTVVHGLGGRTSDSNRGETDKRMLQLVRRARFLGKGLNDEGTTRPIREFKDAVEALARGGT